MLTTTHVDGGGVVIVASKSGDDRPSAWFLNLCDSPAVTVEMAAGAARPMMPRIAGDTERAPLWDTITTNQPRYARYQNKTECEITVGVLEPVAKVWRQY